MSIHEVHHKLVGRQKVVQSVALLVAHGASFQLSNSTKRINQSCKFHITMAKRIRIRTVFQNDTILKTYEKNRECENEKLLPFSSCFFLFSLGTYVPLAFVIVSDCVFAYCILWLKIQKYTSKHIDTLYLLNKYS